MMCTYGLNYQSIVYLCYQSAGPTESASHEKVKERKKNKQKKQRRSPDGSAEVQIRANDLIVRRSAEGR